MAARGRLCSVLSSIRTFAPGWLAHPRPWSGPSRYALRAAAGSNSYPWCTGRSDSRQAAWDLASVVLAGVCQHPRCFRPLLRPRLSASSLLHHRTTSCLRCFLMCASVVVAGYCMPVAVSGSRGASHFLSLSFYVFAAAHQCQYQFWSGFGFLSCAARAATEEVPGSAQLVSTCFFDLS